ncbi:hypothetical protein D0962_20675 [Leptolyngbyaceae cyanobacterium CCMR0082]|uniref:Mobilization protein n=1 Tax=Adonisia turfae CCMR0082 TaxID=2304604 RepID=A0A6M0S9N3_9CYAN|nr:hypothetical protein [Adonisia turfae]NEZ65159.1 hypothetical protein [Adonisia turfae CCMR0082]
MAGKSLTKRLADLQQKKADLDAQIKQIEQEQSRRLRREKQERARIIGMAIFRLVEKGEDWTEEKLMGLVSPFIVSGKERRFLGLAPATGQLSEKEASGKTVMKLEAEGISSKSATASMKKSALSKASSLASESSRATTQGRLPEVTSEEDILSEFNL